MTASTEEQVRRLDLVLAELDECPRSDDCNILHEHVYGAKVALLGAMHDEYSMNLELARKAAGRLENKETRNTVEALLNPVSKP
jgi:hypothetical protein